MPFQVNVFDSTFRNAEGGDIFSNDGGSLVIQDSSFIDSGVMAIGAVSDGGVIMIMDSQIEGGNIEVINLSFCLFSPVGSYQTLLTKFRIGIK